MDNSYPPLLSTRLNIVWHFHDVSGSVIHGHCFYHLSLKLRQHFIGYVPTGSLGFVFELIESVLSHVAVRHGGEEVGFEYWQFTRSKVAFAL